MDQIFFKLILMKRFWSGKKKRRQQLDDHVRQKKVACFGYRSVAEDQKAHWVRSHFNTVANDYDLMNTILSFGIHHLWKRKALKMLALKPDDRVLDLCGGTGDLAVRATRHLASPQQIILYDINPDMIRAGLAKGSAAQTRKQIAYIIGDAERMALAGQRFDAVMVGFGMRNLTHMIKGFAEIYRVLRPGGKMICLEFSKPTTPWFRWLYDFYSFYIMPIVGKLVVGSRKAYTYLPESIRLFSLPHELKIILEEIGFTKVIYQKLTNGIAVVHYAEKPQHSLKE
ncbi:MAG: bifunctional demethylmenaquinone methyltransferase/2-methoxy-6-polyprenyl-1,4-benzoquinol methylase UbiE [Deltaproteobacteria bacterium]|nr:bifunctional demethylmenaquinone methyltransferase/2-methoxy-6-polyprenyl-1,4-benzoquinol methylase UbiE [Deltaproteobacteria bacterium]